jgi:hypothetical protein
MDYYLTVDSGAIIDDINLIEHNDTVYMQRDLIKARMQMYDEFMVNRQIPYPYIQPIYQSPPIRTSVPSYSMYNAPSANQFLKSEAVKQAPSSVPNLKYEPDPAPESTPPKPSTPLYQRDNITPQR